MFGEKVIHLLIFYSFLGKDDSLERKETFLNDIINNLIFPIVNKMCGFLYVMFIRTKEIS